MNGESQNIFYLSNNVHNIQIYNEDTFVSRGFNCKISLVNTSQQDTLKGGYEQKETISIPYRYFDENARYLQDKLKIQSLNSTKFVDFFKSIPIYMKKKYDEINKPQGSAIDNKNRVNVTTLPNSEIPTIDNNTQIQPPLSEPIEKLKEDNLVNIDKITEIHPIQLENESIEQALEPTEKEEMIKKMEGLEFLKIELEEGYEIITEKEKSYKELEMIKDFLFYLIDNKKKIEIENEKTVIVKSEKGVVIIGELSELNNEIVKNKEYFEKEKIKGTPLYKELELM